MKQEKSPIETKDFALVPLSEHGRTETALFFYQIIINSVLSIMY